MWWTLCVTGAVALAVSTVLWSLTQGFGQWLFDRIALTKEFRHGLGNRSIYESWWMRLDRNYVLRRRVTFGLGLTMLAVGIFGLTR